MLKLLPLLLLSLASYCYADIDAKAYVDENKKPDLRSVNGVYLNGVGQGLGWANYWMKEHGLPPMYCQPDSLPLDGNSYLHMVDRQIEVLQQHGAGKDVLKKMSVAYLLQQALIESFPCPKK